MSKKPIALSRRKILAGIGAAGVASVGAGLGTSAYFNDTESFTGNSLTAGELDLKVDWQQSYYGPAETLVPVNAYPDHDGDGLQSIDDNTEYVLDNSDGENEPITLTCGDLESGADLPSGVFNSPNRSADNGGPVVDQDSLVALSDVKPGDWGEITFSLHLCDNPGYVWLTADNYSQSGGTLTEPEQVAMNETDPGSVTESDDTGSLADNTYVELWYDDDCDNIRDTSDGDNQGEVADVVIVLDRSGSMDGALSAAQTGANELISALGPDDQVGLVSFSTGGTSDRTDDSTLDADLTTDHGSVQTTVNSLSADGGTNMEAAVERAHEELTTADTFSEYDESGNARSGTRKIMVVLSDGQPNEGTAVTDPESNVDPTEEATNAKDDDIEIFTIAYGSGSPSGTLGDMASDPADYPDIDKFAFNADVSDVVSVFRDIGSVVGGGETLILGKGDGEHTDDVTLAEAMAIMANNDGRVPLDGTGDMGYGEGPTSEERDCFPAGAQKCIGMKWWIPADVGNEIQGDTVSFDLGFYTEQCRHNDGSGPSDSAQS